MDRKRDKLLGPLKTVLRGRSRESSRVPLDTTPEPADRPSTSEPGAGSDLVILEPDAEPTKDHWQLAYDKLTQADRDILSAIPVASGAQREVLDQVIQQTEKQYNEDQRGRGKFRTTAHRIINSAMSFQDVVGNVVKFDPTGYALSAWAVVSLGLTVRLLP